MAWAPDYITADELQDFLRIGNPTDEEALWLQLAATGASRAVDQSALRQFGKADGSEQRAYTPRWSRTRGGWLTPIDDVMTSVGLQVHVDTAHDGTYATEVTDYVLRPRNAARIGRPWEAVLIKTPTAFRMCGEEGEVRVTANPFGWTAVPPTARTATFLQGSRIFSRREAPFGIAGSPEGGGEMRLLARVDPDVAVTLTPYRRKVRAR